jgi:hypothetical protein
MRLHAVPAFSVTSQQARDERFRGSMTAALGLYGDEIDRQALLIGDYEADPAALAELLAALERPDGSATDLAPDVHTALARLLPTHPRTPRGLELEQEIELHHMSLGHLLDLVTAAAFRTA